MVMLATVLLEKNVFIPRTCWKKYITWSSWTELCPEKKGMFCCTGDGARTSKSNGTSSAGRNGSEKPKSDIALAGLGMADTGVGS